MSGAGRDHDTGRTLAEQDELARRLEARVEALERDLDRYRAALRQIASGESGVWGWIAHDALHPQQKRGPPDPA